MKKAVLKFLLFTAITGSVKAQNLIQANGNIGIGTTNPATPLHIVAPANAPGGNFNGGVPLLRLSGRDASFSEPSIEFTEQGNAPIASIAAKNNNSGAGDLILSTRNWGAPALSPKLYIRNDGMVGIGTTTPDHKLVVAGTDAVAHFMSSGGQAYIRLSIFNDINRRIELVNRDGRTALWNPLTSDVFNIIHSNGFVGIGTASPSSALHITSPASASSAAFNGGVPLLKLTGSQSSFSEPSIAFSETSYAPIATISAKNTNSGAGDLIFSTRKWGEATANPRLYILNDGNVGIGVTNPDHKLVVLGNDNVAAFVSNGANSYIRLWANGAGGINERIEFVNRGNGVASIWTPGAGDALVIARDGKVKIGSTNTPAGYRLYVQTGILTEKVKVAVVNSTNWADYVFAADYKLKSLDEVDQFIKAHHHLPNVASADEMVKEGNDLGKTDALLLSKIEELTLYMIDVKKSNDQLKAQNESLQNQINELKQAQKN